MDWNRVIVEIKATGMTQEQIAEQIGVSAGTLSELLNGKINEPRWSRGDALLALHSRRCAEHVS